MRTLSSSNLSVVSSNPSTSNPKRRNCRRSKQPFILEESPIDTMADQRTMAELLRAPTEGYAEAIVDRYKDLLRACPHHGFTELHQLDTFYNALNPADQDSLNAAAGGNLLERQIAKLTHAVNQQMSAVTTAMMAILKQFQATPPPASVKAVEEICVTCGGAHPYYQCLAAGGNTFSELRDNIQGYVSAVLVNYNQGNSVYRPPGSGSLPNNTVANPKGKLKAITTRSGLVLDGPTVPIPPPFINLKEDEHVEETLTDPDLSEYTIKVPPSPKMLKALLSNKEKLQELVNTPLNENCLVVILKKLPEKLGDPGKFLIPCGFSELKCKALADLGASINLMPLSVWKKLGLPELISTRMTLKLANRAICTPAGIARDVFVPVSKFTLPVDFVIVDYESDPRVPLILGRPFLRTARALIDIHGEKMILRDGDERLTLNMRHDTSSYSNQHQKESINLINIFNNSSKDFLKDLFSTNQPSGNPTFSSHPELTLPKVQDDIFDLEGGNVLPEKLLDLDSTKDLHHPLHDNPLSGSTTYSSSPNQLLEELVDELALITFPLKYDDDLQFDVESDLKEIKFLLHQDIDSSFKDLIDQSNLANPADNFVDSMPEMFTDEHALDYSSSPIVDEYDDDFLEVESDAENVYDDPFDSKGEKIKESKLLIDELDLPCNFLFPSKYDSFICQDFSRVDALPSTNNEDKVFNPGILSQEKPFEIITRVVQDKKLAISNASLVLEDFDPPLYEPLFFKEVHRSNMLLPFSSENKEKVFKPGIHTSEKVHSSFIPELSHQGYKVFKINQSFKSPMKIFFLQWKGHPHLGCSLSPLLPLDQFKYGGIGSS
nr:reverse transcriptase domain-containing protein [Tanacetum cinerariifolium]